MQTTIDDRQKSTNADNSQSDDDDYEEITFVMTLRGIFDPNLVRDAVTMNNYRFAHADTDRPFVQIGDNVFAGAWDTSVVGTDMLLSCMSGETNPLLGWLPNTHVCDGNACRRVRSASGVPQGVHR